MPLARMIRTYQSTVPDIIKPEAVKPEVVVPATRSSSAQTSSGCSVLVPAIMSVLIAFL
jgi:hypothetical protein